MFIVSFCVIATTKHLTACLLATDICGDSEWRETDQSPEGPTLPGHVVPICWLA